MKQMMVSCFAKADTEYFSYDGSAKYTKLSIQHDPFLDECLVKMKIISYNLDNQVLKSPIQSLYIQHP